MQTHAKPMQTVAVSTADATGAREGAAGCRVVIVGALTGAAVCSVVTAGALTGACTQLWDLIP